MKQTLTVFLFVVLCLTPCFAQWTLTPVWEVPNGAVHTDTGAINLATGDLLVNEWDNAAGAGPYYTQIADGTNGSLKALTLNNGALTRGDFLSMCVSSDGHIYGHEGTYTGTIAHWPSQSSATPNEFPVGTGTIRAMKVVGTGNNMKLYLGHGVDADTVLIATTSDSGQTFTVTDTIAAPAGKTGAVGNLAGDTVWSCGPWEDLASSNVGDHIRRFTKSGATWTRDTSFSTVDPGNASSDLAVHTTNIDYDEDDNIIVAVSYDDFIAVFNATTGAQLAKATITENITYIGTVSLDAANNKAYVVFRAVDSTNTAPSCYWACWSYGPAVTPTPLPPGYTAVSGNWTIYE